MNYLLELIMQQNVDVISQEKLRKILYEAGWLYYVSQKEIDDIMYEFGFVKIVKQNKTRSVHWIVRNFEKNEYMMDALTSIPRTILKKYQNFDLLKSFDLSNSIENKEHILFNLDLITTEDIRLVLIELTGYDFPKQYIDRLMFNHKFRKIKVDYGYYWLLKKGTFKYDFMTRDEITKSYEEQCKSVINNREISFI